MGILDFLFPRRCVGCGMIGGYFCKSCRHTIQIIGEAEAICPVCERPAIDGATHPRCRTRYSIDGLTAFFRYDGVVRKAVKSLKYRRVFDLASEFVSLIPSFAVGNGVMQQWSNGILVPIPLHPSRFRYRGFNQAEVLGGLVAAKLQLPIRTDVLRRTRHTIAQVDMRYRPDRLKNMEHAFRAYPNISVSVYRCVLMFDDVFTTGATMRSAANALKRAGAQYVWAVTMAR